MKRNKRILAFILVVAMLSSVASGCAASGSSTPDEVVKRFFDAVFDADGGAVMDCMFPSLSHMYNAAASFTISATGEDPEYALAESMAADLTEMYGIYIDDIRQVKNEAIIISRFMEPTTATLHTLLVIEIDGQYDYEEIYVICNMVGSSWYVADMRSSQPYGYAPTEALIPSAMLETMYKNMDAKRLKQRYGVEFDIDDEIKLYDGRIITLDMMEQTWKAIDDYQTSGTNHLFSMYLTENDPLPPFYFETFVLSYRDDPLMQASVAVTEAVSEVGDFTGDVTDYFFGDVDAAPVISMLDSDKKVAELVIDYLKNIDLLYYEKNNKIPAKLSKDAVSLLQSMQKAIDEGVSVARADSAQLLTTLKRMNLVAEDGKTVFKLGELLKLDENNVRQVAEKLYTAIEMSGSNFVEFDIAADWGAPVDVQCLSKLSNATRSSDNIPLTAWVNEEVETLSTSEKWAANCKKIKNFTVILSGVLSSAESTMQLIQYQRVLDEQEAYLTMILQQADCENAKRIASEIIRVLSETVAKGYVDTIAESFFTNTLAQGLDDAVDEVIQYSLGSVLSNINVYQLMYEVGTAAAMVLCNGAETKLQVWSVEDGYKEFQKAKGDLSVAMGVFHENPTAENYVKLYYTAEYYSLLVRAGSQKVSDILCADAESLMSKFTNIFAGGAVDQRLERLYDAQQMPAADEEVVDRFLKKLFP